jgi:pyruvate ferredoxin oxidoreductase alpha subunit
VGNRAIGSPINIWNDQSDSMSMRDAGWIQLFAETNQQAIDVHIQAFKIAETLSMPVMVCVDGFILTHAYERMDVPDQEQVDRFLPPFEPRQVLDPSDPISIGAMVGPEAFTEVRYMEHHKQLKALEIIPEINKEFKEIFGRDSGGLISTYRADDADTLIVTLGSVIGTISEVIDEMRDKGQKIGAMTIRSFRPFPLDEIHEVLKKTQRVVVFEKCLAVGLGGIVASNVRMAHRGLTTPVYTVIGGLGGRPITRKSLKELFEKAMNDDLEETTFLDLKQDVVDHEIDRAEKFNRSGAIAENVLRQIGVVDVAKTS